MKKALILAFLLAGCSSLQLAPVGPPTLAGLAKYTPPTAKVLGPACEVPTPNQDDKNACDLYKVNMAVCAFNITKVGGVVNGVLMMVPMPQAQAAATLNAAAIEPLVSAEQLYFCNMNGYLQPAAK